MILSSFQIRTHLSGLPLSPTGLDQAVWHRMHHGAKASSCRPTANTRSGEGARWFHCSRCAAVQAPETPVASQGRKLEIHGLHHVGFLIENLERSMEFYQGILGLELNYDRPDDKLPYRGAWLMLGPDMLHLMELKNPDPKEVRVAVDLNAASNGLCWGDVQGRAEHGGQDRHICVGVPSINPIVERLEAHNIEFTKSKSGRQALFFRDLDMNTIEVVQQDLWR